MWGYVSAAVAAFIIGWSVAALLRPEMTATARKPALRRSEIASAGVLLFIIFAALASWFWPAASQTEIKLPLKPYEIGAIVDVFEENEVAGEKAFGHRLKVIGIAGKTEEDFLSTMSIEMSDTERMDVHVGAVLSSSEREHAARVHRGDLLTLICEKARMALTTVMLDDCAIVPNG